MIEMFVRRHVLTTVLVLIAIILGVLSYTGLGVRRFPKIDFPVVTVTTVYPGGSPSEIETEITKRVEDAISSISGIDNVKSYSQQGVSAVVIQFNLDQDVDIKAVDIRNQVDKIHQRPARGRRGPDGREVLLQPVPHHDPGPLRAAGPE